MSHTIELSDEQYVAIMRAVAARPGATLESLVAEWAEAVDPPKPEHYYEDVDEMFRALGASEEVIAEGDRIFHERQAQDERAREIAERERDQEGSEDARGEEAIAAVVAEVAEALRDRMLEPRCFETDEWLRHLGVSDEEIEASNRRVEAPLAGEDTGA